MKKKSEWKNWANKIVWEKGKIWAKNKKWSDFKFFFKRKEANSFNNDFNKNFNDFGFFGKKTNWVNWQLGATFGVMAFMLIAYQNCGGGGGGGGGSQTATLGEPSNNPDGSPTPPSDPNETPDPNSTPLPGLGPIGIKIKNFKTGQDASFVIGQPDFMSNVTGPEENRFNQPYGNVAMDSQSRLFVSDSLQNRVMGWDPYLMVPESLANIILSKIENGVSVPGTENGAFNSPRDIAIYGDRMFVADSMNHRVLVYSLPTNSGALPLYTIGGNGQGCSLQKMNRPTSVAVTADKILVVDNGNHRILIYENKADLGETTPMAVLGNKIYDICHPYYNADMGEDSTKASAYGLNGPEAIWTDGTRIVVTDAGNNRVVVWNSFPIYDEMNPEAKKIDFVIGQADLYSKETQETLFNEPTGVTSDGQNLIIADSGHNRVLIWNELTTAFTKAPDIVLGQNDFDTFEHGLAQNKLNYPRKVSLIGGKLYVTDVWNSRILVFEKQAP